MSNSNTVPTKIKVNPTLAKYLNERAALHAKKIPLSAEANLIRDRISKHVAIVGVNTKDAERAAELLGEGSSPVGKSDRARLVEIDDELSAVNYAIEILTNRISLEDRNATQSVLAQVKPQYAQAVSALCDAMIAVNRANRSYYAITDALNDDGVNWCSLNPMAPLFLGNPKDNYSPVACFLHEAVEHGYFEKSNLPKELAR